MMVTSKRDAPTPEAPHGPRRAHEKRAPEGSVVAIKGLLVPLATYEAISEYVYLARQPNPFLHAVLSNDLLGACQQANVMDAAYLRDTVLFVYNHCPRLCCGSPQNVVDWMDRCLDHFRRVKS